MSDLVKLLLQTIRDSTEANSTDTNHHSQKHEAKDDLPLSTLKLSSPTLETLLLAGIQSVEQLMGLTGADLVAIPGVDVVSALEIKKSLARFRGVGGRGKQQLSSQLVRNVSGQAGTDHGKSPPLPKDSDTVTVKQGQAVIEPKQPLTLLNLPTGYVRALNRHDIHTVDDLCIMTVDDLARRLGLGKVAANTIRRALERGGRRLATVEQYKESVAQLPKMSSQGADEDNAGSCSPRVAHPNGPRKWMDIAFMTLSKTERHILIARNGLDGQAARPLETVVQQTGLPKSRAASVEATAKARLRHRVVKSKLKPLTQLFDRVIQEKGRACTPVELAVALGYPDSGDGCDPLAFTAFILEFCEDMYQVDTDRWAVRKQIPSEAIMLPSDTVTTSAPTPDAMLADVPNSELHTVKISSIRRVEARLAVLTAAIAAEANAVVDLQRLREFAAGAGVRVSKLSDIDVELGGDGIWLASDRPGELRLNSSHRFIVSLTDLPGKLSDLDFLRAVLPRVGVIRPKGSGISGLPRVEVIKELSDPPGSGRFPAKSSEPEQPGKLVRLASLNGNDVRLVVLAIALAAESGSVLNLRRLMEFGSGAGVKFDSTERMAGLLRREKIEFDELGSDDIRLGQLITVLVSRSDLPGRLANIEFMRTVLRRVGVVRPRSGEEGPRCEVRYAD